MRALRNVTLFIATFLSLRGAAAQGLPELPPGGYYINCPSGLNNIAFDYSLLPYAGHYWDTEWRTTLWTFPLPSRNWYAPVGTSTLISTDGKARWEYPQIEVLCWIYNAMDILSRHYDPVRFSGTVKECGASGSGGDVSLTTSDIGMDPSYDPYDTYDPGGGSCEESGGSGGTGGGTGGGGSVCHTEAITIEISYDDGMTWETWWEGYATVCEK